LRGFLPYNFDITILLTVLKMRRVVLVGLLLLFSPSASHAFPWYASGDNIWGAQLMTAEERQQHVQRSAFVR
jgi:hypothetical protein